MPNKKSAIKHLRQTEKRTSRNSLVKRNIKELIKQGKKAIADGSIKDKSGELTHSLQKAVDKAVKTGILKNNTGNRKKSRFADMVKKAGVAPQATVKKEAAKEEAEAVMSPVRTTSRRGALLRSLRRSGQDLDVE